MTMKIVFIGCVEFSFNAFQELIGLTAIDIVGVVTRKESRFNADFRSLEPVAATAGIPCFLAEGNNQSAMAAWISALAPDVVYCFGWSYLLGPELLNIPRLGVVGYHPAALPRNRGRHPIIWALVLGLKETASTFFFMDEGADSGDIISQCTVSIEETDDASSLYRKLTAVAHEQIAQFTRELASGNYRRIPQQQVLANYWRKRSKRDGEIDWRMSARSIHNLVRALTRPYPGAHCVYKGEEVSVWKTEVVDDAPVNIEPGKVLSVHDLQVVIKCGEGAIRVVSHEFKTLPEPGSYV